MPENHFGEEVAARYDESAADMFDPAVLDPAVEFLAALAGDGAALELGIGTGRIALPLAQRGVRVSGIDLSEAMVAKLREKPGGEGIDVTIGDFADVGVDGLYRLIFVGFNTFFALESQEEQVRCFENVARRLTDDGVFCIDAFVPDPARFAGGRVSVSRIELDLVQLDVTLLDQAEQKSTSQHVVVRPDGVRFYPVNVRWAYPPELDLMARLASLELRERFGSWRRDPFTKESGQHVSVYGKA